jgi:hypothetical protein
MNLDLRIPMGLLFMIVGALMAIFGLFTRGSAIYATSGGLDINLIWGIVMLVFGVSMFLLGRRADKRPAAKPVEGTTRPLGRSKH